MIPSGTPIERIHLPESAYRVLIRAGIDTVEQLCSLSPDELRRVRRCGVQTFKQIVKTLTEQSLSLAPNPPAQQ